MKIPYSLLEGLRIVKGKFLTEWYLHYEDFKSHSNTQRIELLENMVACALLEIQCLRKQIKGLQEEQLKPFSKIETDEDVE